MTVEDLIHTLNSFPKTATVTFEYPTGDYWGHKNITPVDLVENVKVVPYQGIYREPKYDEWGDLDYQEDADRLQSVVVLFSQDYEGD